MRSLKWIALASLLAGAISLPTFSYAEEKEKKEEDKGSGFRCEKMRGAKLPELKAKLVENCNLDKPFSMAATDNNIETSWTYCCHVK